MSRLFRLSHWAHVFKKAYRLIRSPVVPMREKLLFAAPVLVYWLIPVDLLPYLPFDDIALTMIVASWFTDRMAKKYPRH